MGAIRDRGPLRLALQDVAAGRTLAGDRLFEAIGLQVYAVATVVTGRRELAEPVVVEAFREIADTAVSLCGDPDAAQRILSLTQRLARDRVRRRPLLV